VLSHPTHSRVTHTVGHEFGDAAHAVEAGELGEKGLDFWVSYFFGVAFVVEGNVVFDLVEVSLFGAVGVVLGARDVTSLIEKFFR
jgi:hypothetical protein